MVIREKLFHILRHPGRMLDLKAKDLIGPDQTLSFSSQSKARINYFCTELTLCELNKILFTLFARNAEGREEAY